MKQVNADHYDFARYCGLDRWASYHYQLREVLALRPASVLEVGVGDGTLGRQLRHFNIPYTSIDTAADLAPDVVGSILKLPFEDDAFDVVCAFEVLEHLPFADVPTAVRELARVARRAVVVSIPHFGPPIAFRCKVPFLPEISFALKVPFPKEHVFNGEHYWEVGKRGYSRVKVRRMFSSVLPVVREFVPFENQYHRFYVLKKGAA